MCERCNELKRVARARYWRIQELEEELDKYWAKLNAAEGRIERELVLRIEQEKKSYDAWVTDPQQQNSDID